MFSAPRARTGLAALRACAACALLLLCVPSPLLGQSASLDEVFSSMREEQVVTGAGKRPQPLFETPSTVTIIHAGQIRAHGYRTVGEALRWVAGFFVTYDRNYTYVGVRGLQRPGDYNNKVLLTLDGHALNGNVYDDALFGPELGLDMEMVERIEVVRGPGSALYGSNAVLAVVNVVTRAPSREPGLLISGRAGALGERRGFASLASSRPGRPAWSLSASWLDVCGRDVYYPEYDGPLTHSGWARDADGERAASFLGVAEWSGWRLTAKFNERMKRFPTGAFGTTFGDRRNRTWDGHNFVELSGTHELASALELHARAYWDGARYRGYYVYGPDSATVVSYDGGDGDLLGTELRTNWSPGPRDVVTVGLEARHHPRVRFDNYDVDPYTPYLRQTTHHDHYAVYLQDEHRLGGNATLTAGARVDRYPGFDPVLSPRADLVLRTGPDFRWKLLAGSAFRAPSVYETDYRFPDDPPQPPLGPERATTVEGAVARTRGPIATTLSVYRTAASELIDLVSVDSLGHVWFENRARVHSYGIEGQLEVTHRPGVYGRLSASWQETVSCDAHDLLSNSPRWNLQLVLTHAPPDRPLAVGVGMRYLSPRLTLARNRTASALVVDGRVARKLGSHLELGVDFRNLFNARHGDPGSEEHIQDQIPQDSRGVFIGLAYRTGH